MIIASINGNTNDCDGFQTPTKRTREGKKVKKLKRQKIVKEVIENIDASNAPMEETTEELQEFVSQKRESPVFILTLSSPEPETPDIKTLIQTIPFTLAHYRPMNRICVDAIGPFNVEEQKAQHVFVIID